ncbi:MAG: Cof-type HAD-IIB family hydrolase [Erysipelotrichaceae bacterium]|nr:Cof-type HAD-IIB family hydrolase [Erysipelotrichaceae bacterium]
MKKLLVFDMDGTLYTSERKISDKTLEIILKAQQDGMRVACATGRPSDIMQPVFEQLQLEKYHGFCVGNNGQELYDVYTKEFTQGAKMPLEVAQVCCKVAAEEDREMYGRINGKAVFRTSLHTSKYNPNRPAVLYDYDKEQFMEMGEFDKLGYFVPHERNDADALEKRLFSLLEGKAEILKTNDECVELCALGVDKCNGIDMLCRKLNLEVDDVLVFGDGLNDVKMMRKYPSCAMGNAYNEVKSIANYVVASNDEDGIVEGILKYAY